MELLQVQAVCKTYGSGETAVHAGRDGGLPGPRGG